MTLPASGNSISLNQIHVEVGGTSGTSVSINDLDVRQLLDPDRASEATSAFSDFFGLSAAAPSASGTMNMLDASNIASRTTSSTESAWNLNEETDDEDATSVTNTFKIRSRLSGTDAIVEVAAQSNSSGGGTFYYYNTDGSGGSASDNGSTYVIMFTVASAGASPTLKIEAVPSGQEVYTNFSTDYSTGAENVRQLVYGTSLTFTSDQGQNMTYSNTTFDNSGSSAYTLGNAISFSSSGVNTFLNFIHNYGNSHYAETRQLREIKLTVTTTSGAEFTKNFVLTSYNDNIEGD